MCAASSTAVVVVPCYHAFQIMLLRYYLNDIEMVPVGHTITCNAFSFTLHVRCIYIVTYYYYYFVVIVVVVSCHRPFTPGTSLEPTAILTVQASSFRLQY
jgi:hypothetical protein